LSFNFWRYLDESLTKEDPIPNIRIANLYPSEASVEYTDESGNRQVVGACHRQSWLRVKLAEEVAKTRQNKLTLHLNPRTVVIEPTPHTPHTLRRFAFGNMIEDMVINEMKDAGILASRHKRYFQPIRYGYNLSGELDMVGIEPDTRKLFGVECKSFANYMAQKQIVGDINRRIKGKPKDSQVLQAAIYADWWPELEYFKLVYMGRDTHLTQEFDITVDRVSKIIAIDGRPIKQYTLKDVYTRYETLAMNLYNNTLPSRDFDLEYTDDKMNKLMNTNIISNTDKNTWEKYWQRELDIKNGVTKNGRKLMSLKRPSIGPWNCKAQYCQYHHFCYDSNGCPKQYN